MRLARRLARHLPGAWWVHLLARQRSQALGAQQNRSQAQALAWLARPLQQVDVILSDVVMPRLGGLGLVKALRQDGIGTPVILMSGYAAGEARAGMRDAGVLAWLDKPLCSATLAGALAGALAGGD